MCEDKPTKAIEEKISLHDRWEKLESNYVSSDFILRITKFQELLNTRLSISNNSLKIYVIDIRNKIKKLKRISAFIPNWILVTMLLNNFNEKFKEFVYRLLIYMKNKIPKFDEIVVLFYKKERLLKKNIKKQALYTIMNKFNKKQKKKKRSILFNRGREGDNNSNNSNAPKLFKNLNNSNYKGDEKSPECFRCSLTESDKKRTH